jgi:SAM-dependent methyltransferase
MSEFTAAMAHTAEAWDARYAHSDRVWSGRVNQRLVEQVGELPLGNALDIGCGEGADAVWLAQRGWRVLAVDVSAVAIGRARAHADEALDADVRARLEWQVVDIREWAPPVAAFDLVSMQFLHLPLGLLAEVAMQLATALRPGGVLLTVNHDRLDLETTVRRPNIPELYASAADLAGVLDPSAWRVDVAEAQPRPATDQDGNPVTLHDTVVRAVRRPS